MNKIKAVNFKIILRKKCCKAFLFQTLKNDCPLDLTGDELFLVLIVTEIL